MLADDTGYSRWRTTALRIPQERLWSDRARTPTENACLHEAATNDCLDLLAALHARERAEKR